MNNILIFSLGIFLVFIVLSGIPNEMKLFLFNAIGIVMILVSILLFFKSKK